jgi:hypothetical protein
VIAARIDNKLLIVIEPGNIEKLKIGKPLIVPLNKFMPELPAVDLAIAYTPDIVWIAEQIKSGVSLLDALGQGLGRVEVFLRDAHDPENLENVKL